MELSCSSDVYLMGEEVDTNVETEIVYEEWHLNPNTNELDAEVEDGLEVTCMYAWYIKCIYCLP